MKLLLSLIIFAAFFIIPGSLAQRRRDRGRSVSPPLLRSLTTSEDNSEEDEAAASNSAGPLCQLDCSDERLRSVCGTDGITYPSRCHLQQAICQGSNVRLDYRGDCSDSETRCLEERLIALKTSNESGIPVFVPVCREDGSYVDVQCHNGTGYCWCVNQDGKPVPGSSIRYEKPKCRQQDQRRRNRRGKKKKAKGNNSAHRACTQADRSEFNSHVTELIVSEYGSLHGRSVPEGRITDHKKERIEWKFDQMDTNRNGRLRKKEFKSFRRKVKRLARNKFCAHNFWHYCDMDTDGSLTRGEWNNCLGVNVNIAFKLFMSLSSAEEQGKRNRSKDKHGRKRKEEEDDDSADKSADYDEIENVGNGGSSALLDSPESNSKDRVDCRSTHREAIESTKSGVPNAYIPECDANGNFNRVQCHKSSKYCWCADENTGESIFGTSVFNARPDCSNIPNASPNTLNDRPWLKCPDNKKKIFQVRLMDFLTMMMTHSNETSKFLVSSDQTLSSLSLEERVADWHFNHLDKNRDGHVSRKELRPLRKTLITDPELRGCGKRIQIHCDNNLDLQIDLAEWNLCVGAKKNETTIRAPSNNRKGPNPLKTWLKAD